MHNAFLGHLYINAYARDLKFGHKNSTFCLQPSFEKPDGSRTPTCSVYDAKYTAPVDPSKPTRLTYREVISCFDEMGHSVHNFASRARYFTLAHTARDFMEMPGVLLEHVFWNPAVIRFISGRRGPDGQEEKIPINTAHQLITSRLTGETLTFNQAVFYATIDLRLHMAESQEGIRNANIVQDFSIFRKELCLLSGPEDAGRAIEDAKTISRLRVFMRYPGVYYSYVLAKVINYGIFESKFRQLLRDEDVEKLEDLARAELGAECKRFREMVLCPGGTLATRYMETLTQYMRRKPSVDLRLDLVSKKA